MGVCSCRASYLQPWLLKALLFSAALLQTSEGCPTSCACHIPTEVHCTFRYLTAVPDHIQPAVERINLGFNSISVLREHDLSGLENVELLMVHSNMIERIEDRTFGDLRSLQVLKMSYNKVKRIDKETFKGLDSLLRLHMDHNHIEFINPEAFYGLTNLQLVHLEGNHLQQLHPDTFITLRQSQVFRLSSVRTIHLSENLLTTLPADIFTGCVHLENVFLHGNPWTCDCRMKWFPTWAHRNPGVLKCKRDRRYPSGQLCPVCENLASHFNRPVSRLPADTFTCAKPWIQPNLKQRNISLEEGDFSPVSPKDFVAPLGSIQMNLTDQYRTDATLSCTVQIPEIKNLTQTLEEEERNNVTVLTASITTYLVCNIDYDHIQELWQIMASYSDSPLRLERGPLLASSPEMVYRYRQLKAEEDEDRLYTNIGADIKASPPWLMQGEVSFLLDRTTTTYSTLHIRYQSEVHLRVEQTSPKRSRYSWTMIKRDNQTKTEHTVLTGGVAHFSCSVQGDPKPLLEWILPDGSKVRAPYSGEDRRITITAEGELSVRRADASDTGLYQCIATNYLDADILVFRLTILSPDVEESEVNGVQLSRPLGGNLVLDCITSGSPRSSIHWILPDHSVLDMSHGNRKVYKNGTLQIQGLTQRDRGFYRCLVANYLGADLLVSQVILTGKAPEQVAVMDSEGSGQEMDAKQGHGLKERTIGLNENPSSSSDGQESRTITSDRPLPRQGLRGRGGTGGRLGQRRGSVSNKQVWSRKVFDKAYRKVDPEKFAKLMKMAHDGSKNRIEKEGEGIINGNSNPGNLDESETGSGVGYNEDHLIVVPKTYELTAEENVIFTQDIQPETTMTQTDHSHGVAKTENDPMSTMENTFDRYIDFSKMTDKTNTITTESSVQSDSTPVMATFSEYQSFLKNTHLHSIEKTSEQPSNTNPVTLQLTVTDTAQETQIQFSGENPVDPETSTGSAFSITSEPNITPVKDSTVGVVIHTDPKTLTSFTAITTGEKQEEITLHATQTIKSPHLPGGSTIISQQQIHILPHKNSRGGGRRRTFQGRRRIFKPNRINDIQSYINKLKQSSLKKEEEVTVTAALDHNRDNERTKAIEVTPTISSLTSSILQTEKPTTTQKPAVFTTSHLITSNAPFIYAETALEFNLANSDINKLNNPLQTERKIPTAQPTTMTPTTPPTAPPLVTINSLAELDTLPSNIRPRFLPITTTGSPNYSSYTTNFRTPPVLQTLPSPPTVKPPSSVNVEESLSSGSGGLPDNWPVIRQRPGRTRGRQGQKKRPFRGKRPFKKPRINEPYLVLTTEVPLTSAVTSVEAETETTTPPYQTISPTMRDDKTAVVLLTNQTSIWAIKPYKEFDWSVQSSLSLSTTPETVVDTSTFVPTTTTVLPTSKGPFTKVLTRVHSNIKPPSQRNRGQNTQRPPKGSLRPTLPSSASGPNADKNLDFDKDQGYTNTPAQYTASEGTSSSFTDFEFTTQIPESKPKMVGGNAASFTILSNSDAFLPCEAVGAPHPEITWKRVSSRTGNTFIIKGRMDNFEVLSNGTLFIQNASIRDRGQYLCLAENEYGADKLLVTLSVVAYPSRILEPKMRDIKSQAGDTVEMKCRAEGRPTPLITWILANRTQVRAQNTDKERATLSSEGTLVINDVSVYDRGLYKCIASNPAGAATATVRLQVVAAPPGIMEEKRQQIRVIVGQDLLLPCTGQGSPQPTVHWALHDGTMVQHSRPVKDMRISVYTNGTLHIKDVTLTDSGIYECIATSSTGSERRVVTLSVEEQESAPQIVDTSPDLTELSFGDQLRLSCSASGEPKPRIMWRLPSKAVVDQWHRMGSRIQVLDNGTLIINTVSDKDAGDYLCVARNKIADDLQLMRVTVSLKPAKIELKHFGKKQVPFGNDLKVDCKASGAPKPEISWGLPDGTLVNSALQSDAISGGGRARRYTVFDNGTLYLNQVGMSEEGDYTCYAENQVGKDEMHVHITVVTTAPRIRPSIQTYFMVKPGEDVRFDCETRGEPKPKIFWILPNNDVIAASTENHLMHLNGSLDIKDLRPVDAGDYVCMARNAAGEDRRVYKLEIDGSPPVINGYRQSKTVINDVAAKYSRKFIDCKAEGHPTPTITWIMPGNIFLKAPYYGSRINVHQNGTLEIHNVRPTDTAEFTCLAKNDGGEASMVVQLEVNNMLRRPIFKNPYNERIVSRSGKTTILNCSAVGNPTPEIIWTLPNGTRFTAGPDRGSRHHLGNDGTLIIYNPQREDAGKYRCGAKNPVGYIEKLIILEVGQKPYILTRPKGVLRTMSGEPIALHCLAEGIPTPRIHWTIPGGHTLAQPQVLSRYHLLENGTLIIYETTLHDRGNYICRAQNSAGEAVLTVPLVVIAYQPRIITGPPPVLRARSGTPIQLNCAATGIPKPNIIWELPDRSLLSTAQQGRPTGSELLHPQGTLIIQRPTFADSGTYKCVAKNYLGTDSKVTYVRVL